MFSSSDELEVQGWLKTVCRQCETWKCRSWISKLAKQNDMQTWFNSSSRGGNFLRSLKGEGQTVNAKRLRWRKKEIRLAMVWWCSPQSCEMWTLKKKHRIYIYIYISDMNLYTSIISLKHWILFWIVGFLLVAAINWRIWCITTQYWIMKKSELLLNFCSCPELMQKCDDFGMVLCCNCFFPPQLRINALKIDCMNYVKVTKTINNSFVLRDSTCPASTKKSTDELCCPSFWLWATLA